MRSLIALFLFCIVLYTSYKEDITNFYQKLGQKRSFPTNDKEKNSNKSKENIIQSDITIHDDIEEENKEISDKKASDEEKLYEFSKLNSDHNSQNTKINTEKNLEENSNLSMDEKIPMNHSKEQDNYIASSNKSEINPSPINEIDFISDANNDNTNKSYNKQLDIKTEDKETEKDNVNKSPQSTAERILTNIVSKFVNSNAGTQILENTIYPENSLINAKSKAISTRNYIGYKHKFNVQKTRNSNKKPAICGEKVEVYYEVINNKNKKTEGKVETYKLGEHAIEEFNYLITGLNANSMIKANFLSLDKKYKEKHNKGNKISFLYIKSLDNNNLKTDRIRIFDEYISSSRPAICGDSVKFDYLISKVNGETITAGEKKFNLGDSNYPTALNYIITNSPSIGSRTVIIDSGQLSNWKKEFQDKNVKPEDFVILTLSNFSITPKEDYFF